MAAPVAPLIPIGIELALGLLACAAFLVCIGLRSAWEHTFHVLFEAVASASIPLRGLPDPHPFGFVRTLDRKVLNALGTAAKKSEHTMGYFFHAAGTLLGWMTRELHEFSAAMLHWATWIENAHLPRWTKALIYAAFPPALLARLIHAAIAADLPHFGRVIINKVGITRKQVGAMIAAAIIAAGSATLPLPHVWPRLGALRKDIANIKLRLRQLEKAAGATGAVALFVAALARLGLKWIRCKNVTKAGRAVCRTDTSLLDSLLGDALMIASVISVVEFARGLQAIEGEALTILGAGIREFPG